MRILGLGGGMLQRGRLLGVLQRLDDHEQDVQQTLDGGRGQGVDERTAEDLSEVPREQHQVVSLEGHRVVVGIARVVLEERLLHARDLQRDQRVQVLPELDDILHGEAADISLLLAVRVGQGGLRGRIEAAEEQDHADLQQLLEHVIVAAEKDQQDVVHRLALAAASLEDQRVADLHQANGRVDVFQREQGRGVARRLLAQVLADLLPGHGLKRVDPRERERVRNGLQGREASAAVGREDPGGHLVDGGEKHGQNGGGERGGLSHVAV